MKYLLLRNTPFHLINLHVRFFSLHYFPRTENKKCGKFIPCFTILFTEMILLSSAGICFIINLSLAWRDCSWTKLLMKRANYCLWNQSERTSVFLEALQRSNFTNLIISFHIRTIHSHYMRGSVLQTWLRAYGPMA